MTFTVIPPFEDQPVMLDDTCYSIPCRSADHASLIKDLLSSEIATRFLRSLVFTDAKRPVTVDILRRLSVVAIARELGRLDELKKLESAQLLSLIAEDQQLSLLMEDSKEYMSRKI